MKIKKILFWISIAFLSFVFGILLMNFIIMPIIVRHGDIVTVPDVTEITLTDAEKLIKSMKLEPYIELYDYDPSVPENYVFKQEPPPGTELKVSRRVKLWVSKGQKEIPVPYLVGLPFIQAENILHRFELKVAKVESVETDSHPPGRVIRTFPEANIPVSKNTGIKIIISKGTEKEGYPMPNLFGRNIREVEKPLQDIGLIIGNIKYIQTENGEEGEIILQTPQPDVLVSPGDTITLAVTTAIPDTIGNNIEEENN